MSETTMRTLNRLTDSFKELAAIYLAVILVGSLVFAYAEDRSILDSIWWAFVTAMTVGYGDIYPNTLIGRIDAVILMHMVPLFVAPIIVTRLVMRIIGDRDQFTHSEQEQIKADIRELKALLKEKL